MNDIKTYRWLAAITIVKTGGYELLRKVMLLGFSAAVSSPAVDQGGVMSTIYSFGLMRWHHIRYTSNLDIGWREPGSQQASRDCIPGLHL